MRYSAKVIEYFGSESPVVWDHWNSQIEKAFDTLAEAEKEAEKRNAACKGEIRKKRKSRVDMFLANPEMQL